MCMFNNYNNNIYIPPPSLPANKAADRMGISSPAAGWVGGGAAGPTVTPPAASLVFTPPPQSPTSNRKVAKP